SAERDGSTGNGARFYRLLRVGPLVISWIHGELRSQCRPSSPRFLVQPRRSAAVDRVKDAAYSWPDVRHGEYADRRPGAANARRALPHGDYHRRLRVRGHREGVDETMAIERPQVKKAVLA